MTEPATWLGSDVHFPRTSRVESGAVFPLKWLFSEVVRHTHTNTPSHSCFAMPFVGKHPKLKPVVSGERCGSQECTSVALLVSRGRNSHLFEVACFFNGGALRGEAFVRKERA